MIPVSWSPIDAGSLSPADACGQLKVRAAQHTGRYPVLHGAMVDSYGLPRLIVQETYRIGFEENSHLMGVGYIGESKPFIVPHSFNLRSEFS